MQCLSREVSESSSPQEQTFGPYKEGRHSCTVLRQALPDAVTVSSRYLSTLLESAQALTKKSPKNCCTHQILSANGPEIDAVEAKHPIVDKSKLDDDAFFTLPKQRWRVFPAPRPHQGDDVQNGSGIDVWSNATLQHVRAHGLRVSLPRSHRHQTAKNLSGESRSTSSRVKRARNFHFLLSFFSGSFRIESKIVSHTHRDHYSFVMKTNTISSLPHTSTLKKFRPEQRQHRWFRQLLLSFT